MELAAQQAEQLDNILNTSGALDASRHHTEIRLASGQVLRVPTHVLLQSIDESLVQPTNPLDQDGTMMVPVIEEQLEVTKRSVATGTIQLEKRVEEYYQQLDVPLAMRTFDIERVACNQPVPVAPPVRQEGDTTIYSLVEEQLVLTTQLILKEELRVTARDSEQRDTRTVTLKREIVDVNRFVP